MSGAPVVSVVIPAYNAADFIGRTLDSVRAQTFTGHETVVVDDGSTDATADVVRAYLSRHGMRGQLIGQQNRGIAAARNTGMRAAEGTYIALLDHDDLWYPDKLSAVLAEFDRHPDAALICHDENITRNGVVVRVARRRPPRGSLYDALLFDGNVLSPSATTLRRDRALDIGGFDERPEYSTVEDYDFWMRFSRTAEVRFLPRVLGEYVLVERAASRRIVFHHAALERMLNDHFAAYLDGPAGIALRMRVRRRLARVYRSAARQLMAHGEAAREQQALIRRMLMTYPLELRNIAVAAIWVMTTLRRQSATASHS